MADNVEAASGSGGPVFATDEDVANSRHVPYAKLMEGADGTFNIVSSSNPLPVVQTGSLTVTANLGSTDNAVLDAIQAATEATQTAVEGTLTVGSHAVTNAGTFAVQAAQSGTWNITNVSGTVSLPTGAATAAKQPALGTAGTASSDVISVQGIASMTPVLVDATGQGDVPITLDGEAVVLGAGTAGIGKLTANSGVDIGDVDVTSISAGANLIGDVGLSGARTSGGTTIFRSIDVDETEDEVKSSGGQVYWIHAMNLTAAVVYLKFYNAAAASVTVGTTTPVLTFAIPTQGDTNGAGFTLSIPNGIAFSTGICVAGVTGVADSDTTGVGTNGLIVNLGYA